MLLVESTVNTGFKDFQISLDQIVVRRLLVDQNNTYNEELFIY